MDGELNLNAALTGKGNSSTSTVLASVLQQNALNRASSSGQGQGQPVGQLGMNMNNMNQNMNGINNNLNLGVGLGNMNGLT